MKSGTEAFRSVEVGRNVLKIGVPHASGTSALVFFITIVYAGPPWKILGPTILMS
jgi:hypothetical protein